MLQKVSIETQRKKRVVKYSAKYNLTFFKFLSNLFLVFCLKKFLFLLVFVVFWLFLVKRYINVSIFFVKSGNEKNITPVFENE